MSEKRLYRSNANRMISGVCAGIAEYFEVDPTLVRLVWAVVTCFTAGAGIVAYIAASIIIPEQSRYS